MSIHMLREGRAYCGQPGVPGDWPEGHRWVAFNDLEHWPDVDCAECLAVRKEQALCVGGLHGARPMIAGTRLIQCEFCGQPARFSPATFASEHARNALFACLGCSLRIDGEPLTVEPLSAQQEAELRTVGIADPQAAYTATLEAMGFKQKGPSQ